MYHIRSNTDSEFTLLSRTSLSIDLSAFLSFYVSIYLSTRIHNTEESQILGSPFSRVGFYVSIYTNFYFSIHLSTYSSIYPSHQKQHRLRARPSLAYVKRERERKRNREKVYSFISAFTQPIALTLSCIHTHKYTYILVCRGT